MPANTLAPNGAGGVCVAGGTWGGSLGGPNTGWWDDWIALYDDEPCYPDCDQSGTLDIFDFLCFQIAFTNADPYACDCDRDPACGLFDFLCFQTAFVGGCP